MTTIHMRLRPGQLLALLAFVFFPDSVRPDDAQIGKLLKAKGAEITESKGIISAISIQDASKLTDEDFRQLGQVSHLKNLSLNSGLNDKRLAFFAGLGELERLQTNQAQITDDGIKHLASLKNLRSLAFFHPGKAFTGSGFMHLVDLPNLERLTVAGSLAFNDEGMAAVGKLTQLKEYRTWHAGATNEGVKKLKNLKKLRSLCLGQRLSYKPPACPNDETIAILAEMKSLELLQLDETRLTFAALKQVKQLPALKKLALGGVDIAKEEVELLRRELLQVKVEWTEPNEVYQRRIKALFGNK